MELGEIRKLKRELEQEIASLLYQFSDKTGCKVDSVDIESRTIAGRTSSVRVDASI